MSSAGRSGPTAYGVKDGKRLTISFLDTQGNREKRLDLITIFRRQLHDTGFDLRVDNVPTGSYLEKAGAGDFDLVAGSLFAPDPDVLRRIYAPDKPSLLAVFKGLDPELSRLLVAGSEALQTEERVKLYGASAAADHRQDVLDSCLRLDLFGGCRKQGAGSRDRRARVPRIQRHLASVGAEIIMLRRIVERFLVSLGVIFGAVTLIFLVLNWLPGDAATLIAGEDASPEHGPSPAREARHGSPAERPVSFLPERRDPR